MEQFAIWFNGETLSVVQAYLFGDVKFLDLLALAMLVDILTGITKSWKNGKLRSRTAYVGYARKIGVFGIIILANIVDIILGLNGAVALATVLFYIVNEGLSILENYIEIGGKVPTVLKDKLEVVNSKGDEKQ